jgi:hypothetical protein
MMNQLMKLARRAASSGGSGGGGSYGGSSSSSGAGASASAITLTVAGAALLMMGSASIYNVNGGYKAIVFNKLSGVKPDVVGEGTHFVIPYEGPAMSSVVLSVMSGLTGGDDWGIDQLRQQVVGETCDFQRPLAGH